jgi:hypothetical protein
MEITHNQDGSVSYEADGLQLTVFPDRQLTEHFTLRELLRSNYAEQRGIVNLPRTAEVVPALKALCVNVLEPLRQAMGQPVRLTSAYRTPCLNACIGGARNSQHMRGEAADLWCPTESTARTYYNYIREHLSFDQLLLEHRQSNNAWWVHVSYTNRRKLRQESRELLV